MKRKRIIVESDEEEEPKQRQGKSKSNLEHNDTTIYIPPPEERFKRKRLSKSEDDQSDSERSSASSAFESFESYESDVPLHVSGSEKNKSLALARIRALKEASDKKRRIREQMEKEVQIFDEESKRPETFPQFDENEYASDSSENSFVVPDDVVDYISSEEEEKPHKKIPRARHVQQEDTASSRPVSPPTNSVAYTRDADKTDETERKLERYEEEEVVYGEEEEEEEEEEKEWVDEHKDKLMFKAGLTDRLRSIRGIWVKLDGWEDRDAELVVIEAPDITVSEVMLLIVESRQLPIYAVNQIKHLSCGKRIFYPRELFPAKYVSKTITVTLKSKTEMQHEFEDSFLATVHPRLLKELNITQSNIINRLSSNKLNELTRDELVELRKQLEIKLQDVNEVKQAYVHVSRVLLSRDMEDLPPEIVVAIFERLNPYDLCQTAQVCRKWHSLSLMPSLWEKLYWASFGARLPLSYITDDIRRTLRLVVIPSSHFARSIEIKKLEAYEQNKIDFHRLFIRVYKLWLRKFRDYRNRNIISLYQMQNFHPNRALCRMISSTLLGEVVQVFDEIFSQHFSFSGTPATQLEVRLDLGLIILGKTKPGTLALDYNRNTWSIKGSCWRVTAQHHLDVLRKLWYNLHWNRLSFQPAL